MKRIQIFTVKFLSATGSRGARVKVTNTHNKKSKTISYWSLEANKMSGGDLAEAVAKYLKKHNDMDFSHIYEGDDHKYLAIELANGQAWDLNFNTPRAYSK